MPPAPAPLLVASVSNVHADGRDALVDGELAEDRTRPELDVVRAGGLGDRSGELIRAVLRDEGNRLRVSSSAYSTVFISGNPDVEASKFELGMPNCVPRFLP